MKVGLFPIVPLLCLFQRTHATNFNGMFQLETAEGEDATGFSSLTCYIIPCMDEQLGWRNIFAPVATDHDSGSLPETADPNNIPAGEEATIRHPLVDLLNLLVGSQQQQEQQEGGFRRNLRSDQKSIKN